MKKKLQKKNLALFLVLIIVFMLVIWFAIRSTQDTLHFEEETIFIINSNGEEIEMSVLIAEDRDQQMQGLMDHDSLCEYCGMLFVYEENVQNSFWMKDTQIPLSIAFISENGTVMEIQHMEPETTDTHKPEKPYRYALEVNQGFFQENQIEIGNEVKIPQKFVF